MPKIGYFTEDRLKNIPRRHWAEHEFSFYLDDLFAALTQEAEQAGAGRLRVKLEKDLCITPFHQGNESSGQSVLVWLLCYAEIFRGCNFA